MAKYWVVRHFLPGQTQPVFPPIFHLTYIQNTGAAFGLFKGQQALFLACSAVVIAWISREFCRKRELSSLVEVSYALVLGGAVSNFIDRVRLGYVIDFLDFRVWPVFNGGDSAITIGVTLLIWHTLFGCRNEPA